jgi:Matrixin
VNPVNANPGGNKPAPKDLFAHLKKTLHQVKIDGQTYYLAEGDTLLDIDQLQIYADARQQEIEVRKARAAADKAGFGQARIGTQAQALIAMTSGGKIVRWKPGTVLSYRVAKGTFGDDVKYQMVVKNMAEATQNWMDTCGVEFKHMQALDDRPGVQPEGALFSVREIDAGGRFIASAFFPNDPKDRRRVLIDPSYYDTDFDKVGVLRHELGHVLGWRHEMIHKNAPPACPDEDDFDTKYLTEYDPKSVMHYFCGGVGSKDLKITDIDRTGSVQIYGPPLKQVSFIS